MFTYNRKLSEQEYIRREKIQERSHVFDSIFFVTIIKLLSNSIKYKNSFEIDGFQSSSSQYNFLTLLQNALLLGRNIDKDLQLKKYDS